MQVGQLQELEDQVSEALAARDPGRLSVVGFGELSIALDLDGRVAKRMPPFSVDGFDRYVSLIDRYVNRLGERGVTVTPTEVDGLLRDDGRIQAYLIQPRLESATLGDHLLRRADPTDDHPLLLAIGETVVAAVDEQVSLDAQVTNWGLTADGLELLDIGTPMLWTPDGQPEMDMTPFLAMIPAITRRPVGMLMTSLMERWKTPEGVLLDAVANLYREGLPEWAEPAAEAWGAIAGGPLDVDEARKMWAEDKRIWPFLTRLKQGERRWRELRRQPYDFFIQTTMGSAALK